MLLQLQLPGCVYTLSFSPNADSLKLKYISTSKAEYTVLWS